MPRRPAPRYVFRAVEEDDLLLLAEWLAKPHAAEWWTDGVEASIAGIREAMDSVSTEPLIVEFAGRPIAYLQSYDPHLEDDHPYRDQPFGTLGIDVTIGVPDLVGVGHGSAIVSQFVDELFEEGVPRVVIDPDPRNARAIRAYGKAGFRPIGERHSVYGHVLLMARDNPEMGEQPDDAGDGGP
ncbi:MAG: acetyltransferase [Rhizobiaceae bacterium]|nr:acetyltransferase [Rhizobiaceae bacterium]